MPLTEKQIYGWTQGWVSKNGAKIINAALQKGGWEGWAQVELANEFRSLPGEVTVEREVHDYENNRQAVDIRVIQYKDQNGLAVHEPPFLIELKCESLFSSSDTATQRDGNQFFQTFAEDIEKLDSRASQAARPVAIMFVFSDEARQTTNEFFYGDPTISVEEIHVTSDAGEPWTISIYMHTR